MRSHAVLRHCSAIYVSRIADLRPIIETGTSQNMQVV